MMRKTTRKRIYIKAFSFRKSGLERGLIALSLSVFFVLFMAQIGLVIPQARSELTDIEVYEGTDLAGEFPEASFVLEADSSVSSDAVVLLNGAPYGHFSAERCTVSVLNRGLVEIDGRACASDFTVTVKNVDPGISGVFEGDTYLVGRGMTIIGRIEITANSE